MALSAGPSNQVTRDPCERRVPEQCKLEPRELSAKVLSGQVQSMSHRCPYRKGAKVDPAFPFVQASEDEKRQPDQCADIGRCHRWVAGADNDCNPCRYACRKDGEFSPSGQDNAP